MFRRWLLSLRVQYTLAMTLALIGCVAAASYFSLLRQREEMLAGLRERAMPLWLHARGVAEALAGRDAARLGRELAPWLRGQEIVFASAHDAAGQPLWRASTPDDALPLDGGDLGRLRRRHEPLCRVAEAAGAPAYVVSLPIRQADAFVGVVRLGYSLEEVALRERVAWRHAGEVVVGVVVAGILLSYLLRRAVLRPLRRLTEEMRGVAAGDLGRRIEVASEDEVGAAARAFNEMTCRLSAAREAIEGYNESLAAAVARVRRELGEAQAQLVQSERLAATGRLAAGVAHEINNPLTGILVLAQCLAEASADPEARDDLREIEAQARRCQQIVENLLAFAAEQPGRCEAVDLNRIVAQAVEAASRQHAHSRVRIARDLAPRLPRVVGDPLQLEHALRNIVANAYQAMGDGGLLAVATKAEDSSVVVTVADTGSGMDAEQADKAFDPFYTTRGVGSGVGLGLSVSHGILRRHGGRIAVASRPGAGTTVTLELPSAAPAPMNPVPAPASSPPA